MSYDLMVFEPSAAPKGRSEFMAWYEQQAEWEEDHSYEDPSVSSSALRAWFLEMITRFPAMNGPHASDDVDDPRVTDYCIGKSVIYAAFESSEAEAARAAMLELAESHGVGFFDVSSDDGGVWTPADGGFSRVSW